MRGLTPRRALREIALVPEEGGGAAVPGANRAAPPVPGPPPVPRPPTAPDTGAARRPEPGPSTSARGLPADRTGAPSGTTPGPGTATAPGPGTATAPDGDPRPYGKAVPTRWGWLARTSLRARLVAIITLLLAAGLGVAALATTTVVSNYLVEQVDAQLEQSAASVADLSLRDAPDGGMVPSDYYVLRREPDGTESWYLWGQSLTRYGVPDIPQMSDQEVRAAIGEPFTVGSTGGTAPAEWRVAAFLVRDSFTGQPKGSAFVAKPLTGSQETVRILGRTLALSGLSIVILGGVVAYVAVRRTLRPLREIETTAAGIAAGDLSRRVRPAAPTTEVGSLAVSLNAMLSQIEQAFAAREASEGRMRQFVSDASHELRTPLATIRGYGELYRMGALDTPDKVDETMGRIEDAATRMGTLVGDLLALARLDESRRLRREPVDLVALARDSAQDLHALDPAREVRVVGLADDAAPDRLVVVGDEDRLRQILANLIGNVARHTPSGTPVEIAVGSPPDGAGAVLEVRDHGPGVTPEQAERMFERFYRADSSRNRASGGSGLGLAIVAAIVGAHRGHVSVATTEGGGLTVRVTLPEGGYDSGSPPPRT